MSSTEARIALLAVVLALAGCEPWAEDRVHEDGTAGAPAVLAAFRFGAGADDGLVGVVPNAEGARVLGTLGAGAMGVSGESDGAISQVGAKGLAPARLLQGPGADRIVDVEPLGSGGELLILATFDGEADLFGQGAVQGEGTSLLVARLGPDLAPIATLVLSPRPGSFVTGSEISTAGSYVAISGELQGAARMGDVEISTTGPQAFFVVTDLSLGYLWHATTLDCDRAISAGLAVTPEGSVFWSGWTLDPDACHVITPQGGLVGYPGGHPIGGYMEFFAAVDPQILEGQSAPSAQIRWMAVVDHAHQSNAEAPDPHVPGELAFDAEGQLVAFAHANAVNPSFSAVGLWATDGSFVDGVQWGRGPIGNQQPKVRVSTDRAAFFGFGNFLGNQPALGLAVGHNAPRGVHGFVRHVPGTELSAGWARMFRSEGVDAPVIVNSVRTDASGRTWVVGTSAATVSSSNVALESAGGTDGFVYVLGTP